MIDKNKLKHYLKLEQEREDAGICKSCYIRTLKIVLQKEKDIEENLK